MHEREIIPHLTHAEPWRKCYEIMSRIAAESENIAKERVAMIEPHHQKDKGRLRKR